MKNKEKKNLIILWGCVFIISLFICIAFLKPHYTHDTYNIAKQGYTYYACDRFMKEARPVSAFINILADFLHIPIDVYMVTSFILSLILLSCSVVMLYNLLRKELVTEGKEQKDKKGLWIGILLVSYLIIFNYMSIEHILFLESCVLGLSMLLTIWAFKLMITEEKHNLAKSIIVLIMAVFCYQGSIALFPTLVITYYCFIKPVKLKEAIPIIIKSLISYVLIMAITVAFVKIIYGGSRIQIFAFPILLKDIAKALKFLVIDSLGVLSPYTHIIVILGIIGIMYLINGKDKLKETTILASKYLMTIIITIGICIIPTIIGSGLVLQARMCICYGATIGIGLLILLKLIQEQPEVWKKILTYIIIVMVFILNSLIYITLTRQHLAVNRLDKEICDKIELIIQNYEEKTGIKVTKIAGVIKENNMKYYDGFMRVEEYTQRALGTWALRDTIIFYTKRDMKIVPISVEQISQFFGGKEWNEFSEEQVVIEGDTIYFCAY